MFSCKLYTDLFPHEDETTLSFYNPLEPVLPNIKTRKKRKGKKKKRVIRIFTVQIQKRRKNIFHASSDHSEAAISGSCSIW